MTKDEFAERLAQKIDIPKSKAYQAIEAIFSTEPGRGIIAGELEAGRDVTVTGFGTFYARERAERQGRNPKTGEEVHIPAKRTPFFKVGKELKEMVDATEGGPVASGATRGASA